MARIESLPRARVRGNGNAVAIYTRGRICGKDGVPATIDSRARCRAVESRGTIRTKRYSHGHRSRRPRRRTDTRPRRALPRGNLHRSQGRDVARPPAGDARRGGGPPALPRVDSGKAQLCPTRGPLPISFDIDATSLADAVAKYAEAAKVGVER